MTKFDAVWEQAARQPGCGGLLKRSLKYHLTATLKLMLVGTNVAALAACSTGASVLADAANDTLEATGLKSPNVLDVQKPLRKAPLKMTAGNGLNAASSRHPVAVVIRLYLSKDPTSFLQVPYDTLIDPAREKQTLDADLVNVREMTLIPGQRHNFIEKILREVTTLGVVVLFHSSMSQRWKFTLNIGRNEKSGIVIGPYTCAMTMTSDTLTAPVGVTPLTGLNLFSPATCGG